MMFIAHSPIARNKIGINRYFREFVNKNAKNEILFSARRKLRGLLEFVKNCHAMCFRVRYGPGCRFKEFVVEARLYSRHLELTPSRVFHWYLHFSISSWKKIKIKDCWLKSTICVPHIVFLKPVFVIWDYFLHDVSTELYFLKQILCNCPKSLSNISFSPYCLYQAINNVGLKEDFQCPVLWKCGMQYSKCTHLLHILLEDTYITHPTRRYLIPIYVSLGTFATFP